MDLAYYKSSTVDQIVSTESPKSSGYTSRALNAGEVTNSGIELLLNYNPIRNNDFDWNLSLNFAKNKSEVVDVYEGGDIEHVDISRGGFANPGTLYLRAVKGEPYGSIVGKKLKRNSEGLVMLDGNGVPYGTDDLHILGNFNPDWTAGISTSFRYKDLTFSCLIDIKYGGEMIERTAMTMNRAGTSEASLAGRAEFYNSKEVQNAPSRAAAYSIKAASGGVPHWTKNNAVFEDSSIPKDANGRQIGGVINTSVYTSPKEYHERVFKRDIAELALRDASYVKLRELTVSYRLPKSILKHVALTNASLSFVGRNLFIFHKNTDHVDPETGYTSGNAQGIEANSLPATRTYGVNLNLKF
jgi:hypothetical protein